MKKNDKFVVIDCKNLTYAAYKGKEQLNIIKALEPLNTTEVECFRSETDKFMEIVDGDDVA